MKRLVLMLSCLFTVAAACAAPAQEKWTSLFNEKDLSGWVVMNEATFVVTNSNLRMVTGMGWLRSERTYTNFVLELEWRALDQGYDSGIFFDAPLEGKPWPNGGCQINLLRTSLGGLVCKGTPGVPAETPPAPLNTWVKFRIRVEGKQVSLDVNDEPAWQAQQRQGSGGYIGIQSENKAFEFRGIRIREL